VIEFVQASTFVYNYEVTPQQQRQPPEGSSSTTTNTNTATVAVVASRINNDDNNGTTTLEIERGVGTRQGDILSSTNATDPSLMALSEEWTNSLHDELATEFMYCDGYDFDSVWILQSKPHSIDDSLLCGGSKNSESENNGSNPDDDGGSNDILVPSTCFVMRAEARIIAYRSPIGKKKQATTKQLWAETAERFDTGEVADRFAASAIDFLKVRIGSGDGGLGFQPDYDVAFRDGAISTEENISTTETSNPVVVVTDDETGDGSGISAGGDSSGITDTGTSQNGIGGSEDDASSTGGSGGSDVTDGDSGNLWVDNGGNTAVGIEDSNSNASSNQGGRWRPTGPIIAVIAVACSCLLLLFLAGVVGQRRHRLHREKREDEEYLRKIDSRRSDSMQYAMGPVDHLDLSDSSDDGEAVGPIVRSELDLEVNDRTNAGGGGKSSNHNINHHNLNKHRGRKHRATTTASSGNADGSSPKILQPHYFHFSGVVTSPSSRERSRMGPLGLSDEFLEYSNSIRHNSSQNDNSIQSGTENGDTTPRSNGSSSMGNHRGNYGPSPSSSSMSTLPPPPHQNSSPRLYQLRDTVKL